jgi:hypothetical protein
VKHQSATSSAPAKFVIEHRLRGLKRHQNGGRRDADHDERVETLIVDDRVARLPNHGRTWVQKTQPERVPDVPTKRFRRRARPRRRERRHKQRDAPEKPDALVLFPRRARLVDARLALSLFLLEDRRLFPPLGFLGGEHQVVHLLAERRPFLRHVKTHLLLRERVNERLSSSALGDFARAFVHPALFRDVGVEERYALQ